MYLLIWIVGCLIVSFILGLLTYKYDNIELNINMLVLAVALIALWPVDLFVMIICIPIIIAFFIGRGLTYLIKKLRNRDA